MKEYQNPWHRLSEDIALGFKSFAEEVAAYRRIRGLLDDDK